MALVTTGIQNWKQKVAKEIQKALQGIWLITNLNELKKVVNFCKKISKFIIYVITQSSKSLLLNNIPDFSPVPFLTKIFRW